MRLRWKHSERTTLQDEKPKDDKEERKRKLLEILRKKADGSKPKRTCTKDNSAKTAARPKTRRIQLGLMSYDACNNKYKRVSLVKGGGTRKVDLPVDFNRDDVIKYAIKLFFPRRWMHFRRQLRTGKFQARASVQTCWYSWRKARFYSKFITLINLS